MAERVTKIEDLRIARFTTYHNLKDDEAPIGHRVLLKKEPKDEFLPDIRPVILVNGHERKLFSVPDITPLTTAFKEDIQNQMMSVFLEKSGIRNHKRFTHVRIDELEKSWLNHIFKEEIPTEIGNAELFSLAITLSDKGLEEIKDVEFLDQKAKEEKEKWANKADHLTLDNRYEGHYHF